MPAAESKRLHFLYGGRRPDAVAGSDGAKSLDPPQFGVRAADDTIGLRDLKFAPPYLTLYAPRIDPPFFRRAPHRASRYLTMLSVLVDQVLLQK
jgi:hypothetical protein